MLDKTAISTSRRESGNALFLILIAVALFAALSYAITQSGRGGGTIDKETAIVAAGQVVEYPASLRTAITRMVITGTPTSGATGIDLTTSGADVSNRVFAPSGGGVTDIIPPTAAGSATAWVYLDSTHAANRFYIKDVGTNVSITGSEDLAVLTGITPAVCTQIQKGLGYAVTTPPYLATAAAVWAVAVGGYAAGGSANSMTGAGAQAANIDGQAFSCISNATSAGAPYAYYHVLLEQ